MSGRIRKDDFSAAWLRAWFALTPEERRFIGGIVLIFVIGLVARYLYLRAERAETYSPTGVESSR